MGRGFKSRLCCGLGRVAQLGRAMNKFLQTLVACVRRPFRANANKITSVLGVRIPAALPNARHLVVLVAHLFGIAADAVGITFPKTVMRVQIAPLPPKRSVV